MERKCGTISDWVERLGLSHDKGKKVKLERIIQEGKESFIHLVKEIGETEQRKKDAAGLEAFIPELTEGMRPEEAAVVAARIKLYSRRMREDQVEISVSKEER